MDHAEAHERIADLALEPGRLADLANDPSPEAAALLVHVDDCQACATELDAWRRTQEAISSTVEAGGSLGDEASSPSWQPGFDAPPDVLRAAVAAEAARRPRTDPAASMVAGRPRVAGTEPVVPNGEPWAAAPAAMAAGRPPGAGMATEPAPGAGSARASLDASVATRRGAWLQAIAAGLAVVLIVGLGVVAVDRSQRGDQARTQARMLVELAQSLDRILRAEHRWTVDLLGTDGQSAGSVSWSPSEIVVLTTALTPPGPGSEYRCWVERHGQRTPIGVMDFAGGVGAWAGSLDRYDDLDLSHGSFGISLETSGQPGGGPPVLLGELDG